MYLHSISHMLHLATPITDGWAIDQLLFQFNYEECAIVVDMVWRIRFLLPSICRGYWRTTFTARLLTLDRKGIRKVQSISDINSVSVVTRMTIAEDELSIFCLGSDTGLFFELPMRQIRTKVAISWLDYKYKFVLILYSDQSFVILIYFRYVTR